MAYFFFIKCLINYILKYILKFSFILLKKLKQQDYIIYVISCIKIIFDIHVISSRKSSAVALHKHCSYREKNNSKNSGLINFRGHQFRGFNDNQRLKDMPILRQEYRQEYQYHALLEAQVNISFHGWGQQRIPWYIDETTVCNFLWKCDSLITMYFITVYRGKHLQIFHEQWLKRFK